MSREGLRETRGAWLIVGAATVAFGAAISLGDSVSVWLTTGVAAGVVFALLVVSRANLRQALTFRGRDIGHGVLVGGAMLALTHGAYALASQVHPGVEPAVRSLYVTLESVPGPRWGAPILLFVILAEELVWREVLFRQLRRRFGRAATVALATAAYALPQLAATTPLMLLVALVCGLVWTLQRAATDRVAPSFWAHTVWSLGIFVLLPLTETA